MPAAASAKSPASDPIPPARDAGRRPPRGLVLFAIGILTLALATALGPGRGTAATQTTVTAVADSTVVSDSPDANYGTSTSLTARGLSDTKPEADVYIKFTVSGLSSAPAGAQLQIYSNATSATGVVLSTAGSDWTETGITYANAPSRTATVTNMTNLTASTWATADVSSIVTGNGTYTFALTTSSTVGKVFNSRETSTPPKLVLNTSAPVTVAATSGSGQTTATGTAFAAPLVATVTDSASAPVSGLAVTFTAPSSGASATFAGGASAVTVTTDTSGVATSPVLTANATSGSYSVSATATGATASSFALTNGSGASSSSASASPSSSQTSQSSQLTVTAVADSTVVSDSPDANYGTSTSLTARGLSDTKPEADVYIKFTVSGLSSAPAGAQLQIYSNATSATGVVLSTAGSDWTETGITYANAPSRTATVTNMANLTASTWATADVSSIVTGNGTYTFALTTSSTVGKVFNSRETSTPPTLVLTQGTASASASPTASASASPSPSVSTTGTAGGALSATGGSGQTQMITRDFPSPLSVHIAGAGAGVAVTFTAPAQGATGTFTGGATTAVVSTDSSGNAVSPTFTAGSTSGSYTVTATADSSSGSAGFALTNRDPVIVTAGDIACPTGSAVTASSCQQAATASLAQSLHPDYLLPLGDDQYDLGSLSDFSNVYTSTWGAMNPIAYPAPGNHEYGYIGSSIQPTGGTGYFTYYGDRSHPLAPGCTTLCTSWYSYDVGNWHLISLDSQCAVIGGCNPGNPEYAWLLKDLNATTKPCVLAYWHIPIYSSSQDHQPDMQAIYQLLYTKHADLVLNGHAHFYERFAPQDGAGNADPSNGIPEFIVGTGGKSFFPIRDTPAANSVSRIANTFGVLQLTLSQNSYSWNFVPTNTGGSTDSGTGTCH